MKFPRLVALAAAVLLASVTAAARAGVKTVVERNDEADATAEFRFKGVPPPSRTDAAAGATFTLVDGAGVRGSGGLAALHDGAGPAGEDDPRANFFFAHRSDGGRIAVDLGAAIPVRQVNTYSWHPRERGPQVYTLYAADGTAGAFDPAPKRGTDPMRSGWTRLAAVDTRPKDAGPGGQYAASTFNSDGPLGTYRYLLFDCEPADAADPFGQTFYSEIDVVDDRVPAAATQPSAAPATRPGVRTVEAGDGKYVISIDSSQAPDLAAWVDAELAPVVREWYPRIVDRLPSDGFDAPRRVHIIIHKDMDGVANAVNTRINCGARWFRQNLKGEAKGAVVHELVHVVQQYGGRRRGAGARPNPGWLVEGIPDYIRWYLYEPKSGGADVAKRDFARVRYDGSYRITANFLNWANRAYPDQDLVTRLNAAMRDGKYAEDLWKELTGKSVEELDAEWKAALAKDE